ncbi:MAG: sulfite reductase [Verrucomicrobia bacterium]|nr:sulfite reductase [Verrucomicrobiota bacterium]
MSSGFSRLNPFSAVIKERYPLTKPGSTKETHHVVLDLQNSGMNFKVGDSLGIYGDNDPLLVARLVSALKAQSETAVVHPRTQESMTLKTFLTQKANISKLTSSFLKLFKTDPSLQNLLNNKIALNHYLATNDVLDFLMEFAHLPFSLQEMITAFSPLLPRFYSVASSLLTHPDEVHLTVAVSTYTHRDELRYGVASHFLSHRAEVRKTVIPCYVQPASHFTLPQDHSIPLIMVGPGTGVAPFRGFLQERIACKASGKHWLFFGERHREHDFFYEDFWNSLVQQEKLSLDLAFSRDQNDKVYVQHKLYEKGAEVWNWLQQGAHFYVCGEADPMAKDVEATLHRICQDFGSLPSDDAKAYIKELRSTKRYLADIY